MVSRSRGPSRTVTGLLVLVLGATSTSPHPIHTTFTEIVQTSAPGKVTVTVRGFEDDLTAAARAVTPGGRLDSAIVGYLRQKLVLTDARGRRIVLEARGIRQTGDVRWLTFESAGPIDLGGTRLANTALTELHPDQVNLVQIRIRGRTRTLLFVPGDRPKPIGG